MDSIFSQSIIQPVKKFSNGTLNKSEQPSTKPKVKGQGDAIHPTPLQKRLLAKTQPDSNVAAGGYPSTPKPPPPPMNFGPGMTPAPKASTSSTVDDPQAHLKAIQEGFKLRKVNPEKNKSTEKPESSGTSFMPATFYLSNGSWGTYKDKLKTMIIESGGKETSNEHLNRLMRKHAKHTNKTGKIDAVAGDRDAEGRLKTSGNISKSEYESYVLGREQTNDRNNDFKQNIDQYLDIYLDELSMAASKHKSSLKSKMQEWFAIPTVVQTPQTFFVENGDLNKQLVKTGCQVQWLTPGDITEDFIDGLIHYDDAPEKIDSILDAIFAREKKKFQAKGEALDNAQKKHKSKLLRLFDRK